MGQIKTSVAKCTPIMALFFGMALASDSALVEAWRKSGRPEIELAKLLRTALPDLPDDTKYLAEIASVDLEKVERFLRICILLLGKNKLLRMLAELKVEIGR